MEGIVFINLSNGQKYRQSFLRSILLDFCPFSLSPSGQEQFVSSGFWLTKQVLCNVGPRLNNHNSSKIKGSFFFWWELKVFCSRSTAYLVGPQHTKVGWDATRKCAECGQIYLFFESNKDLLQYLTWNQVKCRNDIFWASCDVTIKHTEYENAFIALKYS